MSCYCVDESVNACLIRKLLVLARFSLVLIYQQLSVVAREVGNCQQHNFCIKE